MEQIVHSGELIAPQQVFEELNKFEDKDDKLLKWAKKNKKMFKELTEEQLDLVKEILKLFPKLIDHNKSTPDADPFIVALSRAEGYCAVTSEKPANQGGRPRIPNVCKHYNIKYLDLREMFKELNWQY